MYGRNDNYLGNFKYRIQTAINYIGINCARSKIKDAIEIIVVDWNSDAPLSQALKLLPDTYDICRYISVTPALLKLHYHSKRIFDTEMAVNVGLRRAISQYAMFIPADILISESTLINLIAILKGERKTIFDPTKTVMCLDRKMLPWQLVEKKLTLMEWDRYIQLCGRHILHDRYFIGLNGGFGGLLLHRDLWEESQGFAENNMSWGLSDTDWGLRMNHKYLSISLEPFGVMLYDMAQKPELVAQRQKSDMRYDNRVDFNNPDWGLKWLMLEYEKGLLANDVNFDKEPIIRPCQNTALEFINQAFNNIVPNLIGCKTLPLASIERILLASLAWYCLTYWPSRYFEFNCHAGLTTLAYAQLCNFGEIYAFDEYKDFSNDINLQSYLDALPHTYLYQIGFRGHAQLITGDSATVLSRLKTAFPGEMSFDVAVLRCDALKTVDRCLNMADDLIDALLPNGALFVTANSVQLFNNLHAPLVEKHAKHFFLQSSDQPFIMFIKT